MRGREGRTKCEATRQSVTITSDEACSEGGNRREGFRQGATCKKFKGVRARTRGGGGDKGVHGPEKEKDEMSNFPCHAA